MKVRKIDEDGNVTDEREVEVTSSEGSPSEGSLRSDYSSFADLYVDAETQAEETEEPGDDPEEDE